jgi:fructosamine-3-kinase
MTVLAEQGAALLGCDLGRSEPLSGGNLSELVKITLADGREAVVKTGPAPKVEAEMLRALAKSGAPVPKVLAVSEAALVLELLPSGGRLQKAATSLGAAVARLHKTTGRRFGWPQNYAFGSVAICNRTADSWPEFWAERRLLNNIPHIPAPLARRVEALAADLPNRLPPSPRPALLHGDLWGGNVLAEGSRVTGLIDPACYCGHAEVDLAMLGLFGQPGAAFYRAYGALEPGHEERLPIYQLWPALVHLRLFGCGYRGMVEGLLSATGV